MLTHTVRLLPEGPASFGWAGLFGLRQGQTIRTSDVRIVEFCKQNDHIFDVKAIPSPAPTEPVPATPAPVPVVVAAKNEPAPAPKAEETTRKKKRGRS